ncbi:MAG: hypothetical protein INQ03_20470 [Candidatus Heimdallarchaeota archaeon]|nr:hypothetical protein [Candidatus Heimdallarchaeota archaeon]
MQKGRLLPLMMMFMLIVSLNQVSAAPNTFIASNGDIDMTDGLIDEAWNNVTTDFYSDVTAINGFMKFMRNESHIFMLMRTSSSFTWVALEFEGTDTAMASGHDGWEFEIGSDTVTAKDLSYTGTNSPPDDTVNDLTIEYVFGTDYVDIEVMRPINGSGTEDITFYNDTTITFFLATNVNHFSSTGTIYNLYNIFYILEEGEEAPVSVPDIVIPVVVAIDWETIKQNTLMYAVIAGLGFMIVHLFIRTVIKPLKHPSRIVKGEFKPPSFKERMNQIKSGDINYDHKEY